MPARMETGGGPTDRTRAAPSPRGLRPCRLAAATQTWPMARDPSASPAITAQVTCVRARPWPWKLAAEFGTCMPRHVRTYILLYYGL